jgi:molecular chaperone GrpE (heat shock protein)
MNGPEEQEEIDGEQPQPADGPVSATPDAPAATTQSATERPEPTVRVAGATLAGDGATGTPEAPVDDVDGHSVTAAPTAPTEIDHIGEESIAPDGRSGSDTTDDVVAKDSDIPPAAPVLADIARSLRSLDERVEESQRLLARQSDLADKLHAENQLLRAGELRAATLPLVRDLLRLHDDVGKLTAGLEDTRDLDLVKASLLDALARNGITTFQPEPGERLDPKQHSVAGVLRTDDGDLDRTVAEVTRVGVRWEDGTTIRVADVRVYKHTPAAVATRPAGQSSDQPNGDTQ